jgi:hypothetical protein
MDGASDKHPAVDQSLTESIYYGWKYRSELGLSQPTIDAMYDILTVDRELTGSSMYNETPSYSLGAPDPVNNQNSAKWKFNRQTYAVLAGATEWADDAATTLKGFVTYMDQSNPTMPAASANLLPDFGWLYNADSMSSTYPSAEYGQMDLGGALMFLPEMWPHLNLTAGEIAKLKAWQRQMLGEWQMDGYLNWDTVWSSGRVHYLSYWLWSLRALSGVARSAYLNMGPQDSAHAKYLFDQAIETYFAMDTLNGDPADYAVDSYYFGVRDDTIFGQYYNNPKSSANAKMVMELAMAVEHGLGSATSETPVNIWSWAWSSKMLHVSTPAYSAAILPYAPVFTGGMAGVDAAQMQNWGISHLQLPRNIWLSGFGGYGQEAFSFIIKRNGVTERDTSTHVPTTHQVWYNGTEQTRTPYDTTEYASDFHTLRMLNTGSGSNYRAEVDTTLYPGIIRTTHRAVRTGTAGTGQVVLSIPTRQSVVMDYISTAGVKTTVWDGATITPAGSSAAAKYIHLKWSNFGKGLLIVPVSVTDATGAKVTALSTDPSGYPLRQPDQDRSLLIYLADGTANMQDVEITFDIMFTDGTDAGGEAEYLSRFSDPTSPLGGRVKRSIGGLWQ